MGERYTSLRAFAETFPVLHNCGEKALAALDERDFDTAISTTFKDGGARYWALVFVLSVWDPSLPEVLELDRFDLHRAMTAWDSQQRAAFAAWAERPWWF